MPKSYKKTALPELKRLLREINKEYNDVRAKGLSLDMSRGKPSKEQLDLSDGLLSVINSGENCISENGADVRNYGIADGIIEAKKFFARLCGADTSQIFVGGNSSLSMMYDAVVRAMLFGVGEGYLPWIKQGKIKFVCPCPGYDRHFAICEKLGIEMIPVGMTSAGPDMCDVERIVSSDEAVKGIWCVPKYSNPTGATYGDETVKRFAALKPKAADFRIFWDNAYIVHDFYGYVPPPDIFRLIKGTENENIVYEFVSTSKITFAGAGVAAMISSEKNVAHAIKFSSVQTISNDKINQLRHARFFKTAEALSNHMKRHAEILIPKFELVEKILSKELGGLDIADWTTPRGGYFISLNVMRGTARRVWELCRDAGIKLTDAGATFPYGNDPRDENLRIAPSYPSLDELRDAANALCVCVKLAAAEKIISDKEASNENCSFSGRAQPGKRRFSVVGSKDRHRAFKPRSYRGLRRRLPRDR